MSQNTNYLITGANRGLGQGLVATYLLRPSTTVIAAVRDPSDHTTIALSDLATDSSSKLIVVKIDSRSETDAATAIQLLQTTHGISHLDVVIANAGIAKTYDNISALSCAHISIQDMHEHFTTNAIGPLVLFQACLPLLEKSKLPKFVGMTTFASSLATMESVPFPNAAYGPSKASLNYLARKIHFEHEGLISFVINPGWARTKNGNAWAHMFGMKEAALSLEESVGGLVTVIDAATREETSGKFMDHTGGVLQW